uniref:F-box/WD repeat-containing protein 7 n=1 Tax=Chelonoidis abingdonii TaxID=106734 RepID=A0A8C0GRX2_CHEAB
DASCPGSVWVWGGGMTLPPAKSISFVWGRSVRPLPRAALGVGPWMSLSLSGQFDGTHIVSGSLDTSIRVWDMESGNCLHTLMGHQSLTSGMELRDNILVSGNADSTVKIWDIKTGQCLQTLQGEWDRVGQGPALYSASAWATLCLPGAGTGVDTVHCVGPPLGVNSAFPPGPSKHQSAVTCLQFSSKFVVTSSDDGTVKLWDLKTGDPLATQAHRLLGQAQVDGAAVLRQGGVGPVRVPGLPHGLHPDWGQQAGLGRERLLEQG